LVLNNLMTPIFGTDNEEARCLRKNMPNTL
jgi:hypothetical protein